MNNENALPELNRRTFLKLAAHVSLLTIGLPAGHTAAAGVAQTTPEGGGYGAGLYGRGVYSGTEGFGEEPAEHALYLPIVNKKEN